MAIVAETAKYQVSGTFKDGISSRAKKAFQSFKRGASAAFKAASIAALAGTTAMIAGIAKVVSAANQQELAITKLEGSLRSTNQFTREYSQALQEQASEFQKLTGFGDELVLDQQALLISMGATKDNIQEVTQAALDLSAGLGVDLRSSSLLLGKALAGDFGTLSRYGILVDKNASTSEKMAQALDQINKKFGGQAAAQALTFQGRIRSLTNSWGDLLEQMGFVFTKSDLIKNIISLVQAKFDSWNQSIMSNRQGLIALVELGINRLIESWRILQSGGDLILALFNNLKAAGLGLIGVVQTTVSWFAAITDKLGITTGQFKLYNDAAEESFQKSFQLVTSLQGLTEKSKDLIDTTIGVNQQTENFTFASTQAAAAQNQLSNQVSESAEAVDDLGDEMDEFGLISDEVLDEFGRTADEAFEEARQKGIFAFDNLGDNAEFNAVRMGNAFVSQSQRSQAALDSLAAPDLQGAFRPGGAFGGTRTVTVTTPNPNFIPPSQSAGSGSGGNNIVNNNFGDIVVNVESNASPQEIAIAIKSELDLLTSISG